MSKVFISQEVRKKGGASQVDYTPALEYGKELVVLCDEGFLPQNHNDLAEAISGKLAGFNFEKDYLILSGDVAIAALVVSIIVNDIVLDYENEDSFNVLLWDRRATKYFPRKITFR